MKSVVIFLSTFVAVSYALGGDSVDNGLLHEMGITMTQAEAVAVNKTLDSLLPDAAVHAELGCSWTGVCDGNSVLDVAWRLKAKIFVKAALYTGLGGVLKKQNITAFIPTDRAFKKLPLPLNVFLLLHKDLLREVLEYHLVNGSFPSSQLYDEEILPTRLRNGSFAIRFNVYHHPVLNDTQTIQGSPISLYDQQASNGVVHLIDDVILKFADGSLIQRLERSSGFSDFYQAVVVAGLDDTIKNLALGTVFAPSNEAIARLPAGYWENLLSDKANLKRVLSYHISPNGVYFSRGVRDGDQIATLNKQNQLTVHVHDHGHVAINNVTVVFRDVGANNGILDGINGLLIPAV